MRVTLIPSDGIAHLDGRAISVDLADMASNIHVVQWSGTSGHIEYTDGTPNQAIETLDDFQPWVQRCYVQRALEDAPPPAPTAAQIQTALAASVQRHLDSTAKTRNYDGILSLASYASSTHPTFRAEGQAGLIWRDAVWDYCYQVLADVQAQTRTIPTEAELIAELPVMVWP